MSPLFYEPDLSADAGEASLSTLTFRHAVQVLRMQEGDRLELTNGKGLRRAARLSEISKKSATVLLETTQHLRDGRLLSLGVSFTKNAARNEWLLEKAAELGVQTIYPLQTERGNRERIRRDRWETILQSAMLQSYQTHLTTLEEPVTLSAVFELFPGRILIAHCQADRNRTPLHTVAKPEKTLILIGPEGDFSPAEISLAEARAATSILLGHTRLRTETAAMAACAAFQLLLP